MDISTIILKFFIIFAFSLIFGLERQRSHKPVGFGTYVFVSIGSCGLAITAMALNIENPLPLLSAIVTGIGFLGAGALIKTTDKIFGFTSAASIWVFAIIGVIIGVGDYLIASIIYILIWIVLFIDNLLEVRGIGAYQKKLVVVSKKQLTTEEITSMLNTHKYKIVNMDINKKINQCTLTLLVEGTKISINQIPKRLFKLDFIDSFKIE